MLGGGNSKSADFLFFFQKQFVLLFFKVLFDCAGSWLQNEGPISCSLWDLQSQHANSAGACEIQFPDQGLNRGPPALEARSLSHWTTREVPDFLFFDTGSNMNSKQMDYSKQINYAIILAQCIQSHKNNYNILLTVATNIFN